MIKGLVDFMPSLYTGHWRSLCKSTGWSWAGSIFIEDIFCFVFWFSWR